MNISSIPFVKHIGIQQEDKNLTLEPSLALENHIGTVGSLTNPINKICPLMSSLIKKINGRVTNISTGGGVSIGPIEVKNPHPCRSISTFIILNKHRNS